MTLPVDPLWTLLAALLTIELGKAMHRWFPLLERGNIPPAVTGGLLLSLSLAWLRHQGWVDLRFDSEARNLLLLVFFATVGFGAHLGRLLSAGFGVFKMCLAIGGGAGAVYRQHPVSWRTWHRSRLGCRAARRRDYRRAGNRDRRRYAGTGVRRADCRSAGGVAGDA